MQKIIEGIHNKSDLPPIFTSNQIYFPVEINHIKVKCDGLSFGYPVDSGHVTEVTYDFAMGSLVEDTIAIKQKLKKPRPPHSGVCPIYNYQFDNDVLKKWRIGLDKSWIDKEFEEDRKLGYTKGETKEEYVNNALENYHLWPQGWRKAYEKHMKAINSPKGKQNVVLINRSLTLTKDSNGDYFFKTQYHCHGDIQKADKSSAKDYIRRFNLYKIDLERFDALKATLSENLALIRNNL